MNILHSSIIKPSQLKLIITKLNKNYKVKQIPTLQRFINYYSFFSTQVIIHNKIVLFKIHTPMYFQNLNISKCILSPSEI